MKQKKMESILSLTTLWSTKRQRKTVMLVGIALFSASLIVFPFAKYPFFEIGPFLPFFISWIFLTEILTSYLLLRQFRATRNLPLLFLSAAFLYSCLIAVPHILTFPNVFTVSGLLGAGAQTAVWLWVFWHAGFPAGIMLYLWAYYKFEGKPISDKVYRWLPIMIYSSVVTIVSGLLVLTTRFHDLMPILIDVNGYKRLTFIAYGVGLSVLGLCLAAFVLTLAIARTRTVLTLWLSLSAFAFMLDAAITLFAGARYSIGWYLARINSLLSAGMVLSTFVYEVNRLYLILAESQQMYKSLFEHHPDAIYSLNLNRQVTSLNHGAETLTGYTYQELLSNSPLDLFVPEEAEKSQDRFNRAINGEPQNYDSTIVRKDKTQIEVNITYVPITVNKNIVGIYGITKNVTEQKEAHRLLQEMSNQDGLTGLANRRFLDQTIINELKRCARSSAPLSIILFDLDCFKNYNDGYGHLQGDQCLKIVADTAKKSLNRSTDLAARYGGEEFCIVLPETGEHGALEVAERIRRSIEKLRLSHAFSMAADFVTISAGISTMIPNSSSSPNELIAHADQALYTAKKHGRNQIAVYNEQGQ